MIIGWGVTDYHRPIVIEYPRDLMNTVLSSPRPIRTAGRVGLLVSIRSIDELRVVAGLGVDVIDFKEPRDGPLAAASADIWRAAADDPAVTERLSAALGECDAAVDLAAAVPPRFRYAKAGPAGMTTTARLTVGWGEIAAALPGEVELVAVAYADHRLANCPPPEVVFAAAAEIGLRTWLIDTFDKTATRDTPSCLGRQSLRRIDQLARAVDAEWVLAGSIRTAVATELMEEGIRPTLFGVRGDVCDGSRSGKLVAERVRRWVDLASSGRQTAAEG